MNDAQCSCIAESVVVAATLLDRAGCVDYSDLIGNEELMFGTVRSSARKKDPEYGKVYCKVAADRQIDRPEII